MTRRDFLRLVSASAVSVALPSQAGDQPTPRALWLRRGGESLVLDIGTPEGYEGAAWMLRDVRVGVVGRPSQYLLNLMAWAQAWLAVYGYHDCYLVHSGLRMPSTNRRTEGARQHSRHLPDTRMRFRAGDVSMSRVDSGYLAKVFALPRYGGVGFYPPRPDRRGFVHVDDDRVRYWKE